MTRDPAVVSNQSWWLDNPGPVIGSGFSIKMAHAYHCGVREGRDYHLVSISLTSPVYANSSMACASSLTVSLRMIIGCLLGAFWKHEWLSKWLLIDCTDKCTIYYYCSFYLKIIIVPGKCLVPRRKAYLKYISEVSWHWAQDNFVGCDSWPVSTSQSHVHKILKKNSLNSGRNPLCLVKNFEIESEKRVGDDNDWICRQKAASPTLPTFPSIHPFKCLFERLQSEIRDILGETRELGFIIFTREYLKGLIHSKVWWFIYPKVVVFSFDNLLANERAIF